jgi:intracellular septation protein
MQFFLEMLSLVAFFVTYLLTKNMFLATAVCMICSWINVFANKIFYGKYGFTQLLSAVIISLFGGIGLLTHQKMLIMIKPTVLYVIFAGVLLTADKMGKNLLKSLLHQQFQLEDSAWSILNWIWIAVLTTIGIINVFVAMYCSDLIWVKFKLIAGVSCSILLAIISSIYCASKKVTK